MLLWHKAQHPTMLNLPGEANIRAASPSPSNASEARRASKNRDADPEFMVTTNTTISNYKIQKRCQKDAKMIKSISHADAPAPTHATHNVPRASLGPSAHKQPLQQEKKKKAKKMRQNNKTTPRDGENMLFCFIFFAFFFFSALQLLLARLRPSEARGTLCVA